MTSPTRSRDDASHDTHDHATSTRPRRSRKRVALRTPLVGQTASGNARVQSVVADEGFWVGADESNRVFVFLSPQARRSAGESGHQRERLLLEQHEHDIHAPSA